MKLRLVGQSACRFAARLAMAFGKCAVSLTNGRIGRVIFCTVEDGMVLLHGFIKKTQKTPQQEIDLAIKRRKEIS